MERPYQDKAILKTRAHRTVQVRLGDGKECVCHTLKVSLTFLGEEKKEWCKTAHTWSS